MQWDPSKQGKKYNWYNPPNCLGYSMSYLMHVRDSFEKTESMEKKKKRDVA